ncbi:MAG: endonuclease/exonuclease/phosphatase family protein, partial [Desulfuromonadales bacterium]|nr:endonuclease/exonuclease/phosphatase family protein [Desulfuromonadales bacterium]
MKIVSFNVNGLRARFHQLQALIDQHQPDIIGLQETKVHDREFPLTVITDMGYQVVYHGQKYHYGVATLSRLEPLDIQKGFAEEDLTHQR